MASTATMVLSSSLRLGRGLLLPRLLVCRRHALRHAPTSVNSSRSFESPASTSNLYPGTSPSDRFSTATPTSGATPTPPPGPHFSGHIPISELRVTHSHSSGPGGQNVNKVATRVDLRFHLDTCTWLSPEVRTAVRAHLGSQLTKDGWMVVRSDRTRSQLMNQADALRKLREAIWGALEAVPKRVEPTAEEAELERKRKLKAARMRVREKRDRSRVKQDRKASNDQW